MSAIRELPPIEASADMMALARENCATDLRNKGHESEAAEFRRGNRDFTWRMRHEVARLVGGTAMPDLHSKGRVTT